MSAKKDKPSRFLEPVKWPAPMVPDGKRFGDRLNFLSPEAQHHLQGGLRVFPARKEKT